VATAAIAGLPPLAGFFSKDEILWFAFASQTGGATWLWALASLTALITAFYMTRLLWLTFLTPSRMSHEAEHHVHESPFSMTSVLVVLAVLSAIGGFIHVPHFLEPLLGMPTVGASVEHLETTLIVLSVVVAVIGIATAIFIYRHGLARGEALAARWPRLHALLGGKYYIDEIYQATLGRPLLWISDRIFLGIGDRFLIDGSLHGLTGLTRRAAVRLSQVETGQLQWYVAMAILGLVGSLTWMWAHG
jgi:NADH-quinone oxidoreductase subunit L